MNEQRLKRLLLRLVSIVLIIAGFATFMPFGPAEEVSVLGYKALCPFTPFSTVIAFFGGITIHRYLANVKP